MKGKKASESKLLFAFLTYPKIKFDTREEGEEVILLLRAHPFTQLGWIFNTLLLICVLVVFNFFAGNFLRGNQIWLINIFAVVYIFTYVWINLINWYFNVGILTNKRLVDIDFNGFLYREISTAHLENIEDMTIKSGGYFGSFFDYGSIYIQTAGVENYIEFHDVPYPSFVISTINSLIKKK
ncbi:MAG: hypothetical protein NZL96_01590 [Patescibacteria group bacterium]|nr:hypothetical protein [Patescibacteria group bacterium]